jgi:hypothetical protein
MTLNTDGLLGTQYTWQKHRQKKKDSLDLRYQMFPPHE